ncbi:NAD(P)-binding protein, partial [Ascobolus immersus RN42]
MTPPLNVCIIGYGYTAKILHIPFIQTTDGLYLHSIVQRHPTATNNAASDFPNSKVYTSSTEAFADPHVDIVFILTSNNTHAGLARDALNNGKHVVVEKPFTATYPEAQELVRLARETGLVLTVYHNRRYDADFLTLRDVIKAGSLGEIHELHSSFNRWKPPSGGPPAKPWKSERLKENGLVYDLGVHLIDQALQVWGKPNRIWAHLRDRTGCQGRTLLDSRRWGDIGFVDDWFEIGLEYDAGRDGWAPRGGLVRLEAGTLKPGHPTRFELTGEKGTYIKYGYDAQEGQLKAGMMPNSPEFGAQSETDFGIILDGESTRKIASPRRGDYAVFFKNLVEVVRYRKNADAISGEPPKLLIEPEEAATVMEVIEYIGTSSQLERTVNYTA